MRTEESDERRRRIGKGLMDARLAAGHPNRLEACRHFGFSPNTLKAHEYGHRSFNLAEAERYAEAFGTTAARLLSPSEPAPEKSHIGAPTAHHVVRTKSTRSRSIAPHGADGTATAVSPPLDGAVGTHQEDLTRTNRTIPPAAARTLEYALAPVVGVAAYGIWIAAGSPPLHTDAVIGCVPGHHLDRQYVRQAITDSRSGQFSAGDYIVLLKTEHVHRPPSGLIDVRRNRGALVENSIWVASGRTLTSDCSTLDEPEMLEFDPDDAAVKIEGIAIAVFKPLQSDV